MTTPMGSIQRRGMLLAVAGLLLVAGCKRAGSEQNSCVTQPPAATALQPQKPTEPVAALEQDLLVQAARSSSDAHLPQPWQDVTPTVRPDAGAAEVVRTWSGPAVLIGRKQVWLQDKAIAPVHCVSKKPGACTPEATRQPSTLALFGFEPGQLSDGKLQALVDGAAALKDKQVPVIADRRVNWQAVDAVMATLRAAGARPQLVAGSHAGDIVDVLGIGTALPEAPTLIAARRAAEPGESVPGSLPADATSLTVVVSASGVSVEVGRVAGEPAYPEILGNIVESLIALAERVRMAFPGITSVTVRADPDAPMEQVVQVIDGLRDSCGRTNRGEACTSRVQLYTTIVVHMTGAPEPPTAGALDRPLHLDAGSPSGLHLSDTPDAAAKPAASGLHLSP